MKIQKVIATATLILATQFAQAEKGFTLKGITKGPPPGACHLYVDSFGYDESFEGPNTFYANVRTSFAPQETIRLVARIDHGKRFAMVSQEADGTISKRLTVQLKGPASEQTLYRASQYSGWSSFDAPRGQRVHCVHLRAVTP